MYLGIFVAGLHSARSHAAENWSGAFGMLEVMHSNRKFTCILQIYAVVTVCIGQPLFPIWSYSEQCQFALIISA